MKVLYRERIIVSLLIVILALEGVPALAAGPPSAQEIASRYVRGLTSGDLGPFFTFNFLYRAGEAQVKRQYPQALWSQQIGKLQDEVRRDFLQRRDALALESSILGPVDSSLFLFQPKTRAAILELRGPSKVNLDLKDTLGRIVTGIPYHTAFVKVEYPDASAAPIVLLQPALLQLSEKKRLREIVVLFAVMYFPSDPELLSVGMSGPIIYSMSSTFGGVVMQGAWRPGPPLVEAVL
ncbi:MAG: hypothetical protein QN120_04645 [Armatimonadota bacterium]|nr:hypothetical protein [Armatimonadota bacterium]